jgi:hypothetical protein
VRIASMSGCEVLEIPFLFQRINKIPRYAYRVPDSFIRDVGCLEVQQAHVSYKCVSPEDPPVDFTIASQILEEPPDAEFQDYRLTRLSPHAMSPIQLLALIRVLRGLEVVKHGAASGTTSGTLNEIHSADGSIPLCVAVLGRHRPIIQSRFKTQSESI